MHRLTILGAGGKTGASASLWNPGNEASLVAWWDMSTPSSYDSTAKTWTARYGTGVMTASGSGATKITTGFDAGNKDALAFVGTSNTQLSLASPGFTQCVTCVALRVTTSSATIPVWVRASGLGVSSLSQFSYGGATARYVSGNDATVDDPAPGTNRLIVSRHALAGRAIRIDGAEVNANTTVNAGTEPASSEAFTIGQWSGSSLSWAYEIAAVGIFTSAAWTTTIVEKIEGFVAHQGLGVSTAILPGGHTYKSSAP